MNISTIDQIAQHCHRYHSAAQVGDDSDSNVDSASNDDDDNPDDEGDDGDDDSDNNDEADDSGKNDDGHSEHAHTHMLAFRSLGAQAAKSPAPKSRLTLPSCPLDHARLRETTSALFSAVGHRGSDLVDVARSALGDLIL